MAAPVPPESAKTSPRFPWTAAAIAIWAANLARLAFIIITKSPIHSLWLSQWIGLVQGAVLYTSCRRPWLNGMYAYLFIFPLVATLVSTNIDALFYLNHVPHVSGIVMLYKKVPVDKAGVLAGLVLVIAMLVVTGIISVHLDVVGIYVNAVGHPAFILVIGVVIAWFAILFRATASLQPGRFSTPG